MTRPVGNLSINPASGFWDTNFNDTSFAIPESFSTGKDGFEQQTFLGASIRNFGMSAGYGDSTSTLSVELVNDEYNKSDNTKYGDPNGDDVYHDGQFDRFSPPPVGSPVFFKFGKKRASVNEAYKATYDSLYGTSEAVGSIGEFHLCFGGILQSYVQNRGPGGNPLYSAQIVDPREILSNVTLILNNYAGTTYNNANMYNLYGFLEYNPTQALKAKLDAAYPIKDIFRKIVNADGSYRFLGYDLYAINSNIPLDIEQFNISTAVDWSSFPVKFPITGTGFSRRGPQGMPFYRIKQSFSALLGLNGALPQEYIDAGFGGFVNFRGHNYIVDLSGLKDVPNYYFFDFDQINLLDFCLEVCDITSSELFVSLLPIIAPHSICSRFHAWNAEFGKKPEKLISGIIRVDSIDKSFQPQYGAIKNYIDRLRLSGTPVENQDVGFELSNVVTDKFIVGAQEVDMYYFSNNNDRDNLKVREITSGQGELDRSRQWRLNTALEQQILPYYGLLGNRAVTIPKGWGSYQQILLDSSLLNAKGVGNYYVATEIELRAALISYERWCEFLLSYNDIYMESIEQNDEVEGAVLSQLPSQFNGDIVQLSKNYAVTVPRSVFDSEDLRYGTDGLPVSACNPPYGYPLYYKRATRIGVQGAGLSDLYSRYNGILTSLAEINGAANTEQLKTVLGNIWDDLISSNIGDITQFEIDLINRINLLKQNIELVTKADVIGLIQDFEAGLESSFKVMNRLAKDTKENSLKVYNFVRAIAEECLGKKFLVKIPKYVNVFYNPTGITVDNNTLRYTGGPFGFKPRATKSIPPNYEFSSEFLNQVQEARGLVLGHMFNSYNIATQFKGALNLNYNPITEQYEYNYVPEKQGGYTNFDLLANVSQNKPVGVLYGLVPQDLTNFLLENSRICPYVRFDNSQYLSFNGVDSSSFTQQVVIGNNFIPDLTNQLDNVGQDSTTFTSFQENDTNPPPPKSIAFVKCDIDDKFYMPPRIPIGIGGVDNTGYNGLYRVTVHGTSVIDIGRASRPKKLFTCDIPPTGGWTLSRRYFISHYVPSGVGSSTVAQDKFFEREIINSKNIIKTKNENLDTNNVYALITLPGRIVATKDARYRDSIFQTINTAVVKHALTMDVVKIPEFAVPNFIGAPPDVAIGGDVGAIAQATAAYNQALEKSINFSLHNRIQFAAPSPIYPDLVVLPLMSKERCYGPWISSLLDSQASVYQNIGGKIEFIKDENLSPWNYQGYDLMNQAGITQAQFANSLLLQSERGGFVVPTAPSGVSIGRALANLGPLITNISVDISDNGIRTTFKMDLYTSSFGKLQKQKQDAISNISRERQKLKDERNTLIRKGLSKNQTNVNYNLIYNYIRNQSIYGNYYNNYQTNSPSMTQLIVSVDPNNNTFVNENSTTSSYNTLYSSSASVQSNDQLTDTINNLPNTIGTSNKYYNAAGISLSEMFVGYSKEPHANMPYVIDNNLNSSKSLYDQIS